jgi:hypothetical protein
MLERERKGEEEWERKILKRECDVKKERWGRDRE